MSRSATKIIGISRRAYCSLLEIDKGIEQRRVIIIGRVNRKYILEKAGLAKDLFL